MCVGQKLFIGVYQIVYVLPYLVSWIEDTYWPWFQQAVLGLSPDSQYYPNAEIELTNSTAVAVGERWRGPKCSKCGRRDLAPLTSGTSMHRDEIIA